ncbi:MAG TPA: threonylcarbamoyl-AMP synthase [Archaeoglobaceae archaeon]|nr:threonylcarbamoyl-AMP synthase [Archaeoglobaceae archaeon]
MRTLILKVSPERSEDKVLDIAAEILKRGGLVAFPTETVYGLGADALNPEAVRRIFEVKQRPADNPLIIHVSNFKQIEEVAWMNEVAKKIIDEFFPGPVAVIMKKKDIVPNITTAGLDKVAVRMPDNRMALRLIEKSGVLAAPSANIAGRPSPTNAKHVLEDLEGKIEAVIDSGETEKGLESTVIDTTVYPARILRPGPVTFEMLENIVSVKKGEAESSRYVHYSTSAELILITGSKERMENEAKRIVSEFKKSGKKVGIVSISIEVDADFRIEFSSLEMFVKKIYAALRELDKKADVIIVEGVEEKEIGFSVMNRLKKAADKFYRFD